MNEFSCSYKIDKLILLFIVCGENMFLIFIIILLCWVVIFGSLGCFFFLGFVYIFVVKLL